MADADSADTGAPIGGKAPDAGPTPDALLDRQRWAHWPYAAERSKALVDLDSLNGQAVRVLARSMASERLVAFVGAGVSMAYGRTTWRGLMSRLYELADDAAKTSGSTTADRWKQLTTQLWPQRTDFDNYADQPMKAQLLSVVLPLLQPDRVDPPRREWQRRGGGGVEPPIDAGRQTEALRRWTALLVGDHLGFVIRTLDRAAPPVGPVQKAGVPSAIKQLEERMSALDESTKTAPADGDHTSPVGLGQVVDVLLAQAGPVAQPADPSPLAAQLMQALGRPSIDHDSPLRQLALDWGIRRFLTTNYDTEIERALAHLGFEQHHTDRSVVHGNQYVELTFDQHSTGRAMAFAVEGPRRHAAVLHLHGDVSKPDSLVIGEAHYQRLYLDDHATRDLVSNAALANFAANPVLFVGSDVSEEDVLRPMRLFMSGVGHRRDRMAVALFATTHERKLRAQRQAALLLKYGVFALFYGEASGDKLPPTPLKLIKHRGEPWLFRLWSVVLAFEKWRAALGEPQPGSGRPDDTWVMDLEHLAAPLQLEGQTVSGPGATHPELDFSARFNAVKEVVLAAALASDDRATLDRAALLLEVTRDWIMGLFLSAKLIGLRAQCLAQRQDDFKPALPYLRPADDAAPKDGHAKVQFRHRVQVGHALLGSRFASPRGVVVDVIKATQAGDPDREVVFDDGVTALCEAVQAHWPAPPPRRRRVVVVTSSRGQGKGGQFDRLALEDETGQPPKLTQLLGSLGGYAPAGDCCTSRVLHVNLSFSNELGTLIGQLAALLRAMAVQRLGLAHLSALGWQDRCADQLEELRRGLHCLCENPERHTRLLVVLGNAGVLFDSAGQPKNGLIQRVLRLIMSGQFARAPLDILMYAGESQVPIDLRLQPTEAAASVFDHPAVRRSGPTAPDHRALRRYNRLNLDVPKALAGTILLHALPRTRLVWLAASYFPDLALSLGWAHPVAGGKASGKLQPVAEWTPNDRTARRLYLASGGSRFALTVLLAWLDAQRKLPQKRAPANLADWPDTPQDTWSDLVGEALAELEGPPSGASVETAIEFVLDRWAALHAVRACLSPDVLPKPRPSALTGAAADTAQALADAMQGLCSPLRPAGWRLATELLWHLGAFSHPVEAHVLLSCPRVADAVQSLKQELPAADSLAALADLALVQAMLELLVHWCLLFRVAPRPLPGGLLANDAEKPASDQFDGHQRLRYCPHRHMQRHLLRLMGGRNVESTQWDQFATTIYASLPDEAPVLRKAAHRTLTQALQVLTRYPSARPPALPAASAPSHMVLEADCIRAAYYLVRSTYSLGVISHLAPDSHDQDARCGHMEQHRRQVRWITHAARYWEQHIGLDLAQPVPATGPGRRWSSPTVAAYNRADVLRPQGLFYPSELVWLYNECGVISLAQGKLQDAEHLLTMAEAAAKHVESDDSGSLHVRIRLQAAMVQIERGRPARARHLLQPIAQRRQGHPVMPWIATYYLGLIDHLGGNYETAKQRYEEVLLPLRANGRSRAAAFVLIHLSDVMRVMRPDKFEDARARANEAFSLAQQGGHEDVRIMAMLGSVRLHVEAHNNQMTDAFEKLSFAEAYAVRMDMPRLACEVHDLRARYLYNQGEYRLSAQDASAGLEIAALYDMKLRKARGLLTLSKILLKRGEMAGASSLVKMGRELATACDYYTCVRGFKELDLLLQKTSGLQHRH